MFSYGPRGRHHEDNTDKRSHSLVREFGTNSDAYQTIRSKIVLILTAGVNSLGEVGLWISKRSADF